MSERKRGRCWWRGHRWGRVGAGYACERCEKPARTCDNCGGQHDPRAFTVCIVERRGWVS